MPAKVSTLLLFGATGDLAGRMLLPSLYGLDSDGLLPCELRIVGTARTELDDDAFRNRARQALNQHLPLGFVQPDVLERFLGRLSYVALDATDPAAFSRL
ncbi:MAG: glucose-6-phosphate dehydrogenase, partial [Rhodospirillales bacterium]